MTHPLTLHPDPSDATSQVVDLLERHCGRHPVLAEELRRHHALAEALACQRNRAEHALLTWQAALARRWSCEVAAQRAVRAVQRQLAERSGGDTTFSALLASAHPDAARTAHGLLQEVRRLAVALELLAPQAAFAAETQAQLRRAADELEVAIARTDACEAERRSVVSEQRVVAQLIERSQERARRLLARHAGDGEPR